MINKREKLKKEWLNNSVMIYENETHFIIMRTQIKRKA